MTLQTPTEDHPSNPQYYIYTLCLSLKFLKSSKFTSQKVQLAIHTLEMGRVKQAMLPPFHMNAGRGVKSVASRMAEGVRGQYSPAGTQFGNTH